MTIQDLTDYVKLAAELVKLVPHLLSLGTYCRARWNAGGRISQRRSLLGRGNIRKLIIEADGTKWRLGRNFGSRSGI